MEFNPIINTGYTRLTKPVRIPVGTNATLASLMTTAGVALNADLKALTMIPVNGAEIHWNDGAAATASTPQYPASGACIGETAATINLYAAASSYMDVIQEG